MMVVVLDSSFIFLRAGLSEGKGVVSTSQRKSPVRGGGSADHRYELACNSVTLPASRWKPTLQGRVWPKQFQDWQSRSIVKAWGASSPLGWSLRAPAYSIPFHRRSDLW